MSFKYRKKPIEVEAYQFYKNLGDETLAMPRWYVYAVIDGKIFDDGDETYVKTLEGTSYPLYDGVWIIRGDRGELYPCAPVIFEATYEKVEE